MMSRIGRWTGHAAEGQTIMTKLMNFVDPSEQSPLVHLTYMTPEEWALVPDNLRQRNTAEHAEYAKRHHLKDYDPVHSTVIMAELPDGSRFKIDAHTRSFLWQSGELRAPPLLSVLVYRVRNVEDTIDLYDKIDNNKAAKGSRDEVYSTLAQDGVILVSPYMRSCNIIRAIKDAYSITLGHPAMLSASVTNITRHWKDQLVTADGMNLNSKRFTASLFAAVLITLRKEPEKAKEFWELYNEDKGNKSGGRSDPIQALWERVGNFRKEGTLTSSSNRVNVIYTAIRAYHGFKQKGKTYGPNALNGIMTKKLRAWLNEERTDG
jgi:hypothetical protein